MSTPQYNISGIVEPLDSSGAEKYQPKSDFNLSHAEQVKSWYRNVYQKDLPISAYGQTELHNKLGLDHHNAFDVSLDPDSTEGLSLRAYLKSQGIPFRAITANEVASGVKATGPHIHIGYESHAIGDTSAQYNIEGIVEPLDVDVPNRTRSQVPDKYEVDFRHTDGSVAPNRVHATTRQSVPPVRTRVPQAPRRNVNPQEQAEEVAATIAQAMNPFGIAIKTKRKGVSPLTATSQTDEPWDFATASREARRQADQQTANDEKLRAHIKDQVVAERNNPAIQGSEEATARNLYPLDEEVETRFQQAKDADREVQRLMAQMTPSDREAATAIHNRIKNDPRYIRAIDQSLTQGLASETAYEVGGVASLLDRAARLVTPNTPFGEAIRRLTVGGPAEIADAARRRALIASQSASEAEQDAGGFSRGEHLVGSGVNMAAELAKLALLTKGVGAAGVPASAVMPTVFGTQGALSAAGQNRPITDVATEGAKGVAIAGLFPLGEAAQPIEEAATVPERAANTIVRSSVVGTGTAALTGDARSALTNAAFSAGVPAEIPRLLSRVPQKGVMPNEVNTPETTQETASGGTTQGAEAQVVPPPPEQVEHHSNYQPRRQRNTKGGTRGQFKQGAPERPTEAVTPEGEATTVSPIVAQPTVADVEPQQAGATSGQSNLPPEVEAAYGRVRQVLGTEPEVVAPVSAESAQPRAAQTTGGEDKEPWQMTRREWEDRQFDENEHRYLPSDYFGNGEVLNYTKLENHPHLVAKVGNYEIRENAHHSLGVFLDGEPVGYADGAAFYVKPEHQHQGIGTALLRQIREAEPDHQMGNQTSAGRALMMSFHRDSVQRALVEGKPVPPEVLADYPDLQAQKGTAVVSPPSLPTEPVAQPSARSTQTGSIEQAFDDWLSGRAYVDARGNYHVKTEGSSSGPVASWNRVVKGQFKNVTEFDAAVQAQSASSQSTKAEQPAITPPERESSEQSRVPQKGETHATETEQAQGNGERERTGVDQRGEAQTRVPRSPEGKELNRDAPLSGTDASMLPDIKDAEVLKPVIRAMPVDVVNLLRGKQLSPQMLLNDPSVLKDALAAHRDTLVSLGVVDPLSNRVTPLGAEVLSAFSTGRDVEILTTGATGRKAPSKVSRVPPPDLSESGTLDLGQSESLATSGTETSSGGAIGTDAEGGTTISTSKRNHEPTIAQEVSSSNRTEQGRPTRVPQKPRTTEGEVTRVPQSADAELVTGVKNAVSETERAERGLSPVEKQAYTAIGDAYLQGKQAVENGDIDPRALAVSVAQTPRPLSAIEVGALGHDRARLINEHREAVQATTEAIEAGDVDATANNKATLDRIEHDLDLNDQSLQKGGREQSAAFLARKMLVKEDYSLAQIISRAQAAKGEKLAPEERAKFEDLSRRLEESEKRLAEYESKQAEEQSQRQASDTIARMQREERRGRRTTNRQGLDTEFAALKQQFAQARAEARGVQPSGLAGLDPEGKLTKILYQMAKNRVRAGVNTVEGVVDDIYESIKEHAEGLSKRDIRDAISGYGRPTRRTQSELATELNRLKAEMRKLSAQEDVAAGTRSVKKEGPPDIQAQARKNLQRQISTLEDRIARGDYTKPPKRTSVSLDREGQVLKAQREALKDKIEREILRQKKTSAFEYLVKWRRAVVLSSVATLGKLTGAASWRNIFAPIEEALGGILSKAMPKLAAKAHREGGFSPRAEAAALRQFVERATYGDIWQKLTTGENSLDLLYGEKATRPDHPFLDFFGHLHGALKTQPQRAEFFRSYEKRAEAAAHEGRDLTDPGVQMAIGAEAYTDSLRAILMNDNMAVDAYKVLLSYLDKKGAVGKTFATGMRIGVPVVKVPTNYVIESTSYLPGVGAAKGLGRIVAARGVDNLSPANADAVMRAFKKQGVGLALVALGYFGADHVGGYYQQNEKRKKGDVEAGDVRIFGTTIPHQLLHAPPIEAIMFGATIRRTAESYVQLSREQAKEARSRFAQRGTAEGAYAAGRGLIGQVPFVDEPRRLTYALESSGAGRRFAGELTSSLVIPPDVSRVAKWLDKDKEGKDVERKPEGYFQSIEQHIPFVRSSRVPAKAQPHRQRRSRVPQGP